MLSAGIAFATIGLGKLNIIAPVVSMFFLISYGLLNYATFFEARADSPSFRPRFRWYDKRFSLAGALACLTVMLAIDVTAGVVALAILFGIYQYLKRTSGPARWADSRRSYHLQRIRANLLAAAEEPEHPRDWRPQLLLFSVDSHRRKRLLQFAEWLEGDTGFTTVVRILEGEGAKMLKLREEAEKELRQDIADSDSEAFPLVIVAPSLIQGIQTLVQGYGIGPLKANTILLNWFEHQPTTNLGIRQILYGRRIKTAFRLGCNIIVLDANDKEWTHLESSIPAGERRIDVWWGDDASSHLMLLLAYLMTRSQNWADATIRVLTQKFEHTPEQALENLRLKLEDFRIEAQPKVISDVSAETIAAYSMDAALVFLPFRLKGNQPFDPFDRPIEEILNSLPITALVLAAEDIILEAEPEAGKAAERATALDALADAEKRVRATEKDAAAAKETELGLKEKLDQMDSETDKGGVKESKRKELKTSLEEAENHAEKAARRAAKARAKAETASRVVEDLGIKPSKSDAEAEEATDSEKE